MAEIPCAFIVSASGRGGGEPVRVPPPLGRATAAAGQLAARPRIAHAVRWTAGHTNPSATG